MANRGLPVNVDGSWDLGIPYAKVGGDWKAINFAYVNVNGTWKQSWANFNKATGGSVSTFTDTNGVKMQVHTFSTSGNHTFTVEAGAKPFRIAAVAAGYNSGRNSPGARGKTTHTYSATMNPGSYTVKVGNPNGGWSGVTNVLGVSGGAGGAGDTISNIFGRGGWQSGGAGGPCCPGGGYARGGGPSGNSERGPGSFYGAGGGAGQAVDPVWQPGYRGIVAIAYEIG